jgi:hypothetical protein
MSTFNSPLNQFAYLKTTRSFPERPNELVVEINKSYVETASAINDRTIGIFSVNRPAITGESWYLLNNQKQQVLRQIYTFGHIAPGFNLPNGLVIPHGLTIPTGINQFFTKIYGIIYTETTNDWRPIPYSSVTAITSQVELRVDRTNIYVINGTTAPTILNGFVDLEWLTRN